MFSYPPNIGGKVTRSALFFTASMALLLLLAAVFHWIGLDPSLGGIAKHRHSGYIVEV